MIPGVRGRLITASFARDGLAAMPGFVAMPPAAASRFATWAARVESALGPASSVRAIADVALFPLLELLGLALLDRRDAPESCTLRLAAGSTCVSAFVTPYSDSLDRRWRVAVAGAIGADARWCLCCNGRVLRLVDARRTWSREFLEFDLVQLGRDREAQAIAWALLQAESLAGAVPFLEPYRFDDAGWVANRWCELLPISNAAKQKLMELPDGATRLQLVDEFLRSKDVVQ